MKATGIVRRIDDLGRVVIPKEIRRTMRIREGDPLEIYTAADGEVIFKKYSPVGELSHFTSEYADALTQGTKLAVLICDRDHCIAAGGVSKKDVIGRPITSALDEIIESRRFTENRDGTELFAVEGLEKRVCAAAPIISSGDANGAVVLLETAEQKNAEETDLKLAFVAAKFLGNQVE